MNYRQTEFLMISNLNTDKLRSRGSPILKIHKYAINNLHSTWDSRNNLFLCEKTKIIRKICCLHKNRKSKVGWILNRDIAHFSWSLKPGLPTPHTNPSTFQIRWKPIPLIWQCEGYPTLCVPWLLTCHSCVFLESCLSI